jgi:glycosyltransferase involved in cell wall biosynthesis
MAKKIFYTYFKNLLTSFTLISQKHIEYMRKIPEIEVYTFDAEYFPYLNPRREYIAVLHPWIGIWWRYLNSLEDTKKRFYTYREIDRLKWNGLVGFDVCDSDEISNKAVQMINQADKIIVPSNFCKEVFERSGVRTKIFRIPHGVDLEWYTTPSVMETGPLKPISTAVVAPYFYKLKTNSKMLLFWLWHSSLRKGLEEVIEVYKKLASERDDVFLVIKTSTKDQPGIDLVRKQIGDKRVMQIYGWIDDYEKIALYDAADITLVFSRGGAFELNALESLARGIPVVTSDWGPWTEYVPRFLQAKRGERVRVLPESTIHTGYGYKVDVEDALNKIHDILENYDDYKERVEEWRKKVLMNEYRWDIIAEKIVEVIKGE